jgi:hypothetical protein
MQQSASWVRADASSMASYRTLVRTCTANAPCRRHPAPPGELDGGARDSADAAGRRPGADIISASTALICVPWQVFANLEGPVYTADEEHIVKK